MQSFHSYCPHFLFIDDRSNSLIHVIFIIHPNSIINVIKCFIITTEPDCPGNLVFNWCQSKCDPVCGEESPSVCTLKCVDGCGCPNGMYRSFRNSTTCYYPVDCPASGKNVICSHKTMPTF